VPTQAALIRWSEEDEWREKIKLIKAGIKVELEQKELTKIISSDLDELSVLKQFLTFFLTKLVTSW